MRTQPQSIPAEELLSAIVSSSDDAIYSKSLEGVLTSWNPAAEKLYGYRAEEAVGRPLAMLVPSHRRGEETEILRRIMADERVEHYETERVRKDGVIVEVSITVSPIKDGSGNILGASTIARDIAEANRLGELGSRLAAIISSSDDAIYSKSKDAILTSWNHGAERLYGYTAQEAIGRPVAILIPPHRAGEEQTILSQILAGEKVDHFDTERLHKDGTIVPVSVTISPLRDRRGDIIGASSIARDISERRHLEEMKDRFIANAAHELRTPLSTLSALASALALRWDSVPEDKRRELLDAMTRQGERARVLINNLLELSQIESGHLPVDVQPVDVAEVIASATESAPPPENKSLHLDVRDGLAVSADPTRLGQVVTNLLTNSYRYGGNSVTVSARPAGEVVVMAVGDDGPGVPQELVEEIFDPFTRGPEAGAKQGSGLGLAISRAIVEACGGYICYRRNEPQGALFEIRLKRAA